MSTGEVPECFNAEDDFGASFLAVICGRVMLLFRVMKSHTSTCLPQYPKLSFHIIVKSHERQYLRIPEGTISVESKAKLW